MMNENPKQTRKSKLNIIDFLLIFVILACLVGIALRFNIAEKIGIKTNLNEVEISFLISDIDQLSTQALINGDILYSIQNKGKIGTLKETEILPAEAFIQNSEGRLVKTYSLNRYDVRGVMNSNGTITEDGFMLDGIHYIAPGKEIQIQSTNIQVVLTVTDIKKIS